MPDLANKEASSPAAPSLADALGEVFSVVSHDLRDPLSAIVMGTQLLLATEQDERSRRVLEAVARAGDRMSLVLRNVSTLRASELELRSQPERADTVVSGAWTKLAKLADRKGVTIERKLDVFDAVVCCDAGRIEEVILLLGDNAVRHANGRPVVVSATVTGHNLLLSVHDEGEGIPKDRLSTVFDWQFNTRLPTREGTGLGLAAARRIVDAHGGSIELKSKPGQGTTAHVSLHLSGPTVTPATSARKAVSGGQGKAHARRPHR